MKRYVTYNACTGEFNIHDTIEEARKHMENIFFDSEDRVYYPDAVDWQIFELKEVIKLRYPTRNRIIGC